MHFIKRQDLLWSLLVSFQPVIGSMYYLQVHYFGYVCYYLPDLEDPIVCCETEVDAAEEEGYLLATIVLGPHLNFVESLQVSDLPDFER